MLFKRINKSSKIQNKTSFVLFFAFIFLFFLGFHLFSNTQTSVRSADRFKKESTVCKTFSVADNDVSDVFSLEDNDLDNPCLIACTTFINFQIDSFDNRSQILKEYQTRIQFHLPLFLRYHAIKIL